MRFIRSDNVAAFTDYRKYRPYLRADFLERCSYCERPESSVGGEAHCEIDHHRPIAWFPHLKCDYNNLYYSCRDCNNTKSSKWPQPKDEAKGRRFSDPCAEDFYQDHAVEHVTGMLSWKSECGRFTIDAIRLNRQILTDWRAERARMKDTISKLVPIQSMLRASMRDQDNITQERFDDLCAQIAKLLADGKRMYGL
jgi:hypothetical protein